jgi:hypothetical protein
MKLLSPRLAGLAFCGWLGVFWLGYLVADPLPEVVGNRRLAEFPRSGQPLDSSWLQQAAKAAIDRAPFRYHSLVARNRTMLATARTLHPLPVSPGHNAVSIGRDGWLFLQEEAAGPREKRVLRRTGARAVDLAQWVTASGRRFCLLPIPDKSSVYPGQTGTIHRWADRHSRRDQFPDLLGAEFEKAHDVAASWIPLWGRFESAAAAGPPLLYWAHDTHWSPTGMILATEALVRHLQPGVWDPAGVVGMGVIHHHGDMLQSFLLQPDTEQGPGYAVGRGGTAPRLVSSQSVAGHGLRPIERHQCEREDVVSGRTLMITDSFMEGALPLVTPWFADITFAHFGYTGTPELAEHIAGCDTLVFTTVERFLSWRMGAWTGKHREYLEQALAAPRPGPE